MAVVNEHGQPVGESLASWVPPEYPPGHDLVGHHVTLRPLDPERDAPGLLEVFGPAPDSLWTYMSFGPFDSEDDLITTLTEMKTAPDWLPYVIETEGAAAGFASYLRIVPRDGVIEIGAITFSPRLQRTTAATEAIYLMIRNVFDLGYRRCEWKCDDLNQPSKTAAVRFGFTYEGTFRQATHYKGRNRDTAWYAIIDQEWPDLDRTYRSWLEPTNFDAGGRQIRSLDEMREAM